MNETGDRLRTWTAVDELVLEVCTMTKGIGERGHEDVSATLRGLAIKCALRTTLAVQGRGGDLGLPLRAALGALAELRYFLYLARRLALIDARRYRSACLRHERAQRMLRDLLARETGPPSTGAGASATPGAIDPTTVDMHSFDSLKEA